MKIYSLLHWIIKGVARACSSYIDKLFGNAMATYLREKLLFDVEFFAQIS